MPIGRVPRPPRVEAVPIADPELEDLVVANTLDDALVGLEAKLAPLDPGLRPGT